MAKETQFLKLAEVLEKLEGTSSSLALIDLLAGFLPTLSPDEVKITAYLLRGEIAPAYSAREFGVAQKMVLRALVAAYDVSAKKAQTLFFRKGDLGLVVAELGAEKRHGKALLIRDVFETLERLAAASGAGSQAEKVRLLSELLSAASAVEAKYIVRTVLGVHRIGVADMTFLSGLAAAFTGDKKNKKTLEESYNVLSDLGEVAYRVARNGLAGMKGVEPVVGVPVRMMLAQRVEELDEVGEHIPGAVYVEYKYDGERAQIHLKRDGTLMIFSRRLENITHQYPEIAEQLPAALKGTDAILEGEVVAYDPNTDRLQPFQLLMRRRRKYEIAAFAKKIPVACFLFDLLYIDGKSLLDVSLEKRRALLEERVRERRPVLRHAGYVVTEKPADITSYFDKALTQGAEGVMIKSVRGSYKAGKRGWQWIKFKKDYQAALVDTFDLVIVGALYGRGRRAGSFGSVLAAAFDPKTNKYYSLTKVGAGFTDEDLKKLPKLLKPYRVPEKHRLVETKMAMDVWFEPVKVIEISGAELTVSQAHTVAEDRIKKGGLALRFPRLLKWRDDKTPEQATSVQEIYGMYKK